MVIVAPPRRRYQPGKCSSECLPLLFKTHLFVRENVRLYNYVGLVTNVYFVLILFKKRLLRVVWLSD